MLPNQYFYKYQVSNNDNNYWLARPLNYARTIMHLAGIYIVGVLFSLLAAITLCTIAVTYPGQPYSKIVLVAGYISMTLSIVYSYKLLYIERWKAEIIASILNRFVDYWIRHWLLSFIIGVLATIAMIYCLNGILNSVQSTSTTIIRMGVIVASLLVCSLSGQVVYVAKIEPWIESEDN